MNASSRAETRRADPLKAAVSGAGWPCDLASDLPCCLGARGSYDNALLRRFVELPLGLASAATANFSVFFFLRAVLSGFQF